MGAYVDGGEIVVSPQNEKLRYSGRIDFSDPEKPCFVYVCSQVSIKFRGSRAKIIVKNYHSYWNNFLGIIVDGQQTKVELSNGGETECITVFSGDCGERTLTVFKRQDACHYFDFLGFVIDGEVCEPPPKPALKLEFYGDSVTAGEVSEAYDMCGQPDPPHNGELHNGYWSYANLTALALNAELHNIAQGGIALLDGTGWFNAPGLTGLETTWDKLRYNKELGERTKWDFSCYTPDAVIVAVGQNDANPDNYMARDLYCEKAENWKNAYNGLIAKIRRQYKNALIVLCTTILNHDENWDIAIDEVRERLGDAGIVRFYFENNGCGTPGHIRKREAEKMAKELSVFLGGFLDV